MLELRLAQWGFRLCVDAWLGCVIVCVTEVGHVRPRTGHATLRSFAVAVGPLAVVFPGAHSVAPADGHGELVR